MKCSLGISDFLDEMSSLSHSIVFLYFFALFSSVQSLSHVQLLQPHGLQHARPPCLTPTPEIYSNSCILSQWCHPIISSSVIPSSSHPPSFPASRSFQLSQFFASGGQSIGVSASVSVLPMNIQDWFPSGWTGWNLLAVQGTFKSLQHHHSSKASILQCSAFFTVQLSHPYTTTGKTTALTRWIFVGTVHLGRLFKIFAWYSLELCIQIGISFLFSFAFLFSSFLIYL